MRRGGGRGKNKKRKNMRGRKERAEPEFERGIVSSHVLCSPFREGQESWRCIRMRDRVSRLPLAM